MRNIYDVIREKEAEIEQIQRDLEALRTAARLLSDEGKKETPRPVRATAASTSPASIASADREIVLNSPLRQFP